MKPISEWTDAELQEFQQSGLSYRGTHTAAFAAEVLRLREAVRMDAGIIGEIAARAEVAEAKLARVQAFRSANNPQTWDATQWDFHIAKALEDR